MMFLEVENQLRSFFFETLVWLDDEVTRNLTYSFFATTMEVDKGPVWKTNFVNFVFTKSHFSLPHFLEVVLTQVECMKGTTQKTKMSPQNQ